MSKYTKGKLTWHNTGTGNAIYLDGNYFAEIEFLMVKDQAKIPANMNRFVRCWNGFDDLLKALTELYNDCRNEPADKQRQKVMEKACQVLRKAKRK